VGPIVSGSTDITCEPRGFVYIASEARLSDWYSIHKASSRLEEAPSRVLHLVNAPSALLEMT